jgi:hypothetical protein
VNADEIHDFAFADVKAVADRIIEFQNLPHFPDVSVRDADGPPRGGFKIVHV